MQQRERSEIKAQIDRMPQEELGKLINSLQNELHAAKLKHRELDAEEKRLNSNHVLKPLEYRLTIARNRHTYYCRNEAMWTKADQRGVLETIKNLPDEELVLRHKGIKHDYDLLVAERQMAVGDRAKRDQLNPKIRRRKQELDWLESILKGRNSYHKLKQEKVVVDKISKELEGPKPLYPRALPSDRKRAFMAAAQEVLQTYAYVHSQHACECMCCLCKLKRVVEL